MCGCGCNTCETKGPLLTEGKVKSLLSEGLQYHIDKQIPLFETIYRIGSEAHLSLIKEARKMYSRNVIDLCEEDIKLIKTHLGEFGLYEGESVPLDLPMINEIHKLLTYTNLSSEEYQKAKKLKGFKADDYTFNSDNNLYVKKESVDEAEYQGRDVELNKPKRGGSKKFYVYVRDPKTKKVKKVSFGAADGGQSLKVKIKDKEARNAFAKRHNCDQKKDRTKAGYWSCNLPRYASILGLGANMNTFW